jgi:hypothetical protein
MPSPSLSTAATADAMLPLSLYLVAEVRIRLGTPSPSVSSVETLLRKLPWASYVMSSPYDLSVTPSALESIVVVEAVSRPASL